MTDQFVPLRVPRGGQIRFFAETTDGRCSASWTVLTTRRTKDVYVANRGAKRTKISLHQSGSYSVSLLTDDDAERLLGEGKSRHLDLWQRPAEVSLGFTLAYEIVLPGPEMRNFRERSLAGKQVVRLLMEPEEALHVYVYLVRPTEPVSVMNFPNAARIGAMDLGGGDRVELVAQRLAWLDFAQAMVDDARAKDPLVGDGAVGVGVRRLGHGIRSEDGTRYVIDIASDSSGADGTN